MGEKVISTIHGTLRRCTQNHGGTESFIEKMCLKTNKKIHKNSAVTIGISSRFPYYCITALSDLLFVLSRVSIFAVFKALNLFGLPCCARSKVRANSFSFRPSATTLVFALASTNLVGFSAMLPCSLFSVLLSISHSLLAFQLSQIQHIVQTCGVAPYSSATRHSV